SPPLCAVPRGAALARSSRAEFVGKKAGGRPHVTVESLRVGGDQRLARFNIRTTEQQTEKVKKAILDAFGPSLARVEMTVQGAKPIAGAAGSTAGAAAKPAAAATGLTRFAGGREY